MTVMLFQENKELYTWLILTDLSLTTIAFGDVRCNVYKTLLSNIFSTFLWTTLSYSL